VIEIDLADLEPHVNGPYTPDLAWPLSKFAEAGKENNYPQELEVGLIGSCTNSSYEDLDRAASVARQAVAKNLKVKSEFTVTPGSEQVRFTVERDGLLKAFEDLGGVVLANACGPCIGQWARHMEDPDKKNSIITSFNRNFAKRNDGNPNTHSFVASPEIVTAMAIAGDLTFNPLTDKLTNENGEQVMLDPPFGDELPEKGFDVEDAGFIPPIEDGSGINVTVNPESKRIQLLTPFQPWDGNDIKGLRLFIKAYGKCTTDHISMAGPWLRYRGHLENISNNLMLGAINAFTKKANSKNFLTGEYMENPKVAKAYADAGINTVIVGDENYGEGSSREHAAMEPRHRGVLAVIVKSFARIHETNLKKQGVLPLTFANPADYDKIQEDDQFDLMVAGLAPGQQVKVVLNHADGSTDEFMTNHTLNQSQIDWIRAGSALNLIRAQQ